MLKEYKTIKEVVGPIMLVEGVEGVKYNELVDIVQKDGEIRRGKVLEIDKDKALVQLFESAQGLQISTSKARFTGKSQTLAVSEDMLVLSSSSGDYKTKTYLYYKDGYLQEMTASESFQFDYQNGSMIMPMETFNIEKINDNLLKVNIVSKGIDTEFYITVMSGIL